MVYEFIIMKNSMEFDVVVDGTVTVKAKIPFKYDEHTAKVLEHAIQVLIERNLETQPKELNQALVTFKFLDEEGWKIDTAGN